MLPYKKYHIYLMDRSPAIVDDLLSMGLEHGFSSELLPSEILAISEKYCVMLVPAKKCAGKCKFCKNLSDLSDEPQTLMIDNPHGMFRQR